MLKSIAVAPTVIVLTYAASLAQQENNAGQIAFNTHCRQCHSMTEGDNRLGPSLHDIFGAKAGQVVGFANYSGSLTRNITWDEATLDKFIASPPSVAPNTNMIYPGVADAAERKKIIAFLRGQRKPKRD